MVPDPRTPGCWSIVLLVLLLVVGPVLPALAQTGGMSFNCNGLSDADCQMLQDAADRTSGIHSFAMPAWALDVAVDAGDQSVQFTSNGTGLVQLPETLFQVTTGLPGMSDATDVAPLMALLQRIDAATVQTVLSEIGLHLVVDHAAVTAPGTDQSGVGELLIKDSGLYVRLEAPTGAEAWFGETLNLTSADLDELNQSLSDLTAQLESDDFRAGLAQASELSGAFDTFYPLITRYVSTTRGADETLSGQALAAFTTTFDLKGLLADPDLPTALYNLAHNPALDSLDADLQSLQDLNDTQIRFLLMTIGLLLGDTSITLEQWIGLDDGYVHKVGFDLGLDVDLSLLGQESEFDTLSVSASFYALLDGINTTTLDGVPIPQQVYPLDDSDNFFVGSPDMIEAVLEPGQSRSDSFTESVDEQDVFGLPLSAGQSVQIELTSEDYPYLDLYGPDGFKIASLDTYYDQAFDLTAPIDGLYLIVGRAYWNMNYDLTIRAQ